LLTPAFSQDRERFLAAGINGYVAKPVDLEELFKQIEQLSAGRKSDCRAASPLTFTLTHGTLQIPPLVIYRFNK
jgi:DNA-binding NarL/FixJ family response regulator